MDPASRPQKLNLLAWGLSALVSLLAILVWGQMLNWQLAYLNAYSLFPLLGLLAFSLMWTHYIVGAARHYAGLPKAVTRQYFEVTSWVVLAAILLHPGIFIWQLWRDGFGLPPQSYLEHYVAPGLKFAVFVGSISLLIFLAYELRRKFSTRPWWRYVAYASDAAMLGIIYHGFQLGRHLQSGWFRVIWLFYAITFIVTLVYIYISRQRSTQKTPETKPTK